MLIIPIKKKLQSLIIIISLLFVLVLAFIVLPSAKKILKLKGDIYDIQKTLEEKYTKVQTMKKSLTQLKQIKIETEKYQKAFVSSEDQLNIITELEKTALANNIEQTINVNLGVNASKYTISFTTNGLFQNQYSYLKALENLPYYININSLNWSKNGSSATSTPVSLRFEGNIYVFPK